jgi:hypothetical protein
MLGGCDYCNFFIIRVLLCSLDVIVTDVILGCDCDKRDGVPGGDQHQYRGEEDHRAQSTAPATSGMLTGCFPLFNLFS